MNHVSPCVYVRMLPCPYVYIRVIVCTSQHAGNMERVIGSELNVVSNRIYVGYGFEINLNFDI